MNIKVMFKTLSLGEMFKIYEHDNQGNEIMTYTVWQKVRYSVGSGVDTTMRYNAVCVDVSHSIRGIHYAGQNWLFNDTSLVTTF